jgi:hypothetical protein
MRQVLPPLGSACLFSDFPFTNYCLRLLSARCRYRLCSHVNANNARRPERTTCLEGHCDAWHKLVLSLFSIEINKRWFSFSFLLLYLKLYLGYINSIKYMNFEVSHTEYILLQISSSKNLENTTGRVKGNLEFFTLLTAVAVRASCAQAH